MNLRVSNISFTSKVNNVIKSKESEQRKTSVVTSPISNTSGDTFEKKEFDINDAIKSLGNISENRNGKTSPKFDNFQLRIIEKE